MARSKREGNHVAFTKTASFALGSSTGRSSFKQVCLVKEEETAASSSIGFCYFSRKETKDFDLELNYFWPKPDRARLGRVEAVQDACLDTGSRLRCCSLMPHSCMLGHPSMIWMHSLVAYLTVNIPMHHTRDPCHVDLRFDEWIFPF